VAEPTELVFIGGGHTHVQVLKRWAEEPVLGVRLTVVLDRPVAVYSGMVPGFVAGDYEANELEIDVRPLADLAGARLILEAATRIDAAGRCVVTEGDRTVPYDLLSINVGSTVRGLDLEGVKEHTLPTRPIGRFVELVAERVQLGAGAAAEAPAEPGEASDALGVVIVGAGAGGVELAFTLRARARDRCAARRHHRGRQRRRASGCSAPGGQACSPRVDSTWSHASPRRTGDAGYRGRGASRVG
jgi:selenide,water dikinase